MPIWSNSRNGNLRYSVNRQNNSGVYIGPTISWSSPKNNRRGCLCLHEDRYGRDCCEGYLAQQGIGVIEASAKDVYNQGAFNAGYDNGYENGQTT